MRSNDRMLNLQLYYVDPANPKEVRMVPALPSTGLPPTWPTDGRDGGVPDPTLVGPPFIQIGTEGGFLPNPVVIDSTPVGYEYNRRNIVVLNVSNKSLFIGPAERADVIIDFSSVPSGSKLILYNDSPAPVPAGDPRLRLLYRQSGPNLDRRGDNNPSGFRPQYQDHHAVPGIGNSDRALSIWRRCKPPVTGSLSRLPGCARLCRKWIIRRPITPCHQYLCQNPGLLFDLYPIGKHPRYWYSRNPSKQTGNDPHAVQGYSRALGPLRPDECHPGC